MVDLSEEELNLVLAVLVSNRLLFILIIDTIVKIGYQNYTMATFADVCLVCVHFSGDAWYF